MWRRHSLTPTLVLIGPSPRYIDDTDYVGGFSREDIDGHVLGCFLSAAGALLCTADSDARRVANEIAFELACGDGRIMPVLVKSRARHDPNGAPLFNRIMLFDATDRRRYERELLLARRKGEQIAKDKAGLLTMLSHDIRNPTSSAMR